MMFDHNASHNLVTRPQRHWGQWWTSPAGAQGRRPGFDCTYEPHTSIVFYHPLVILSSDNW